MPVAISGFQEFPYIVPRFLKATGEVMGRSPAMVALPDVKMINLMSKTIIQAAQKQIDPPLLVPDDGFLLPIRTQPGGLNFFRSGTRDTITPLNTGANIPIGLQMEEQRRGAIRSAFYVDQLLSAATPNMTATEVVQRQEERMRVIGPVLGRLMNEMLRPMIDRVFALMLRNDMLAVPPEVAARQGCRHRICIATGTRTEVQQSEWHDEGSGDTSASCTIAASWRPPQPRWPW